ncbi:MAG: Ig-like domain-containing protein, partial [Cyclobacteriaceae bacterium]
FPTSVSIADGTASATVTLAVAPDDLIEGEEILKATIENPSIGAVNTDNADATIDDADDDGATQVNIATVQNGTEAGDDVVYSVTLSDGANALTNVSGSPITVDIDFAAGSEAVQADLSTTFPTSVSIADGTASATVTLSVIDDTVLEGTELLRATINNPSLGTIGAGSADADIIDNDEAALTIDDASAQEGDPLVFTVTLDNAVAAPFTVDVSFSDVSATGSVDYDDAPQTISFTGVAGETQTFSVTSTEDADVEDDETFTVQMSASNPLVTDGDQATGTITNDDFKSDLAIEKSVDNDTPAVGDDVVFTITVTNNGPSIATGVSATDQLPSGYTYVSDDGGGDYNSASGVWTIGSMADDEIVSLNITVTVNATGIYTNTATVAGDQDDPGPGPNTDTETPIPGLIQGDIQVSDICEGDNAIAQLSNFDNLADGLYRVDYSLNSGSVVTINNLNIVSGSATFEITEPAANTYTIEVVKIFDASMEELNIDDISNSFEVKTVPSIVGVDPSSPTSCNGTGSIGLTLSGVPDGSYNFSFDGGIFENVAVSGGLATIDNLLAGDYNDITLTIAACTSIEDIDVVLTDPALPTMEFVSSEAPSICNASDGTIVLSVSNVADGSYTIAYDGGSFDNVPVQSGTATISGVSAGTYQNLSITVSGCTSVEDVDVVLEDGPVPGLTVASTTSPTCSGTDGSITFTFTNVEDGDYAVTFDGGSFGNLSVVSGEGTISNISQGTYNNITIDVATCSSTDGVNVVLNCNPPVADDENVTISEDTPVTVSAVTGDFDPDGSIVPSTIVLTDPNDPSNTGNSSTPLVIAGEGTYVVDTEGRVTFTPELNFNGVSRVNYTVEDNEGNLSNIATITVTVTPVNDGPEAIDDVESVNPGQVLTSSVGPNDVADPEGDNVSYSVVGGTSPNETSEGTLSFNPDGSYTFTPVAGFTGVVEFEYEACDDGTPSVCSTATVSINVGTNEPPVADDETISTNEDSPVTLDITEGDIDSDGSIVTSSIILIDPNNSENTGNSSTPLVIAGEGTYSVDADGNLTFEPTLNFTGISTVSYTIKDNLGARSNVATVTITVDPINDGPGAVDDEETMDPGTTLVSSVGGNDIPDPEGDNLTYSVVGGTEPNPATEGNLTFNPDGSFEFTPIGGFEGLVTFSYEVCDDGVPSECSTATVTIDVTDNLPPVADNDSATTDEDKEVTILVVDGDTDADGTINPGTIILIDPNDATNTGNKTTPLEIAGEGTYEVDNLGNVTFIPAFNFNGTSQVNYTVKDNLGATSNVAEVVITVTPLNDAPIADNESASIGEDTPITIDVTDGDIDFDGNIVPSTIKLIDPNNPANVGDSITPVTITGEGTYSVDASGNLTFTPDANFTGTASINYTIEDDEGAVSNVARVNISVTPVNDGPEAIDDVESVNPGEVLTSSVGPNDVPDPEGDNVSYSTIAGTEPDESTQGTLVFNPDGSYTFTPVVGFEGLVEFDYQACDDGDPQACSSATVSINVGVNTPPVADNDATSTDEDEPVSLDITDGDVDSDGSIEPSSILLIDPSNSGLTGTSSSPLFIPGEGTYSVDANGNLTFVPIANFNGTSTVQYTIKDNLGAKSNVATVTVTVNPVNDGPGAVNDEETMSPGTTLTSSVTGNDLADPEGDALSYAVVPGTEPDEATEGNLIFLSNGSYQFTPVNGFVGIITFQYEVCDNGTPVACSTAEVTINVSTNIPPVADNDDAIITEDNQVTIFIINGDDDEDGTLNPFEIVLIDPADPGHTGDNTRPLVIEGEGTYSLDPLGNVTFKPEPNFVGTSTINYTVEDNVGAKSNIATITITVTPVNDPPVAVDDEVTGLEDEPIAGSVLDNDTDPEGDDLTVNTTPVTPPSNGTLVINPDGTFTYTPDDMFNGTDSFVYEVCDNGSPSACDRATVVITVDPVNDPPVAMDDEVSGEEDTPISGSVLDNDTDPEGDDLTVNTTPVTPPSNGTLVINPDGTFTYTPDDMFNGTDSFVYEVCDDGSPSVCDQATVTITVGPVNDPPMAMDDEVTGEEDTPVSGNVLDNDTDPEGDELTVNTTPVTPPSNGTLVLNPDGTFTYTPDDMFNGTDSFVYEVCDNGTPSVCDQATVTITVGPVNDPPVAVNDEAETDFETPVSGNLISNDEDPDGDDLVINTTPVNPPSNGTLVINPDGTFTYTPDDGFVGSDEFTYEVCDNGTPTICSQATVSITVNSTNEAPEAADDVAATDSITPVEGNVLDNDTDPNGDNLTVNPVPVISPMNGTLVLNPDGSYIYTPDPQFEGEDTFEYEVCDDGVPSLCTTAEVVITVELPPLVVPQIFGGPNNPSWYIEGIEEYPDNEVKVFNRWGNLVFEIKGYDNSSRNWASESSVGIILGSNLVPDGTYFYVIDLGDGSKPKSGFVVVNR